MSYSSSSSSSTNSSCSSSLLSLLDHFPTPPPPNSDHLCYVHCNLCDTVLAVSVPGVSNINSNSSLLKSVTVRCGRCTNLLPVNLRPLFPPSLIHLPPPEEEEMPNPSLNFMEKHNHEYHHSNSNLAKHHHFSRSMPPLPRRPSPHHLLPRSSLLNRPPEKRQRVPSAYNRFIKDEIQRIKSVNPNITHREAFSAAAKNWAHFPHIQFGLKPDHTVKKTDVRQQQGEDVCM